MKKMFIMTLFFAVGGLFVNVQEGYSETKTPTVINTCEGSLTNSEIKTLKEAALVLKSVNPKLSSEITHLVTRS